MGWFFSENILNLRRDDASESSLELILSSGELQLKFSRTGLTISKKKVI